MDLRKKLADMALSNDDMDYFGVSSIDRLANLPEGHRPADLLPEARSVIVMGMRIPESALQANRAAFSGLRQAIFSFSLYGYNIINESLNMAALRLVRRLENLQNVKVYPIPASAPRDEYRMMQAMPNRYAAVCAGLGEFGWSGFPLTPKDGPRVRWISVITSAELEPDPLYAGPSLCRGETCRICASSCPVGALSNDEAVAVDIGGNASRYSLRNKSLCRCATAGLVRGTPGRLQADVPRAMNSPEEWYELSKKDGPWQRMELTRGSYCHRCMVLCPAGRGDA